MPLPVHGDCAGEREEDRSGGSLPGEVALVADRPVALGWRKVLAVGDGGEGGGHLEGKRQRGKRGQGGYVGVSLGTSEGEMRGCSWRGGKWTHVELIGDR